MPRCRYAAGVRRNAYVVALHFPAVPLSAEHEVTCGGAPELREARCDNFPARPLGVNQSSNRVCTTFTSMTAVKQIPGR